MKNVEDAIARLEKVPGGPVPGADPTPRKLETPAGIESYFSARLPD